MGSPHGYGGCEVQANGALLTLLTMMVDGGGHVNMINVVDLLNINKKIGFQGLQN
jgi:hypothetical protein